MTGLFVSLEGEDPWEVLDKDCPYKLQGNCTHTFSKERNVHNLNNINSWN